MSAAQSLQPWRPIATFALVLCGSSVAFGEPNQRGSRQARPTAQSALGAPAALIGTFGNSPKQCQSYNRKSDNVSTITKDTYTFCGGSSCEAQVVRYQKTADGYKLHLISIYSREKWTTELREISSDVFEEAGKNQRPKTLVRCNIKDIEAGVGLPAHEGSETRALDAAFAAFYAKVVPAVCPLLRFDGAAAQRLIVVATDGWEAHLRRYNLKSPDPRFTFRDEAERDIEREKHIGGNAARQDYKDLPSFCDAAERAFGPSGRVHPNLLFDPRKKADIPGSFS